MMTNGPDNVADEDLTDVIPPVAVSGLAAAWILLFGGRGILAPFLLASGLLTRESVENFDLVAGPRLYLVLLILTILIIALRAVRASEKKPISSERKGEAAERPSDELRTDSGPSARLAARRAKQGD